MTSLRRSVPGTLVLLAAAAVGFPSPALAIGDGGKESPGGGGTHDSVEGDASGKDLMASVSNSKIKLTYPGGQTAKASVGELKSVDPTWEPPACWYEPVFSPKQLKDAVATGEGGLVNAHVWWSNGLWVDHYEKGKADSNFDLNLPGDTSADGYKKYNLGKKGMFWRSTVRKGMYQDSKAWDCGRIMFWQDAGTIPKDKNAPTPETLAAFAYDKIKVPDTEVELKPEGKSTVNLPTWAWLDKATFKDVTVRADLPGTGLWAVTTAKPVALHLEPGIEDAKTFPASGDCPVNEDGSIGAPYKKGNAGQDPPCGIQYLRATSGEPYELKVSITWEISWEGTGGAKGDLPDGTFETTQDMNVQEIQSINR
ncbi:hypothetical protein [Streptomyces sp. NPDC020607]|uniref:hypothetical protein n=1 Tax=Streptomyces sp. NPDC020607 TaxID=3365082 RepID=UPI003799C472